MTQFKSAEFFFSQLAMVELTLWTIFPEYIKREILCYERPVCGYGLTYLLIFILTTLEIWNEMKNNNLDNNHEHK